MNRHTLIALIRGVGWVVAAVATTWLWANSTEKSSEPPLPRGVTIVRDLNYRVVDGRRLNLDLYLPAQTGGEPRPAIIALHGGSWVGGSKRDYGPQFARFAALGFVVAVVDYRLARPAAPSWEGAVQDVAHALNWLSDHAPDFRVDPDRLTVIGTSAGGLLAAHLAFDDRSIHCKIQAVVCLSTPFDLVTLARDRGLTHDPVIDLVGGVPEGFAERAADASPMARVAPGGRPMLLIHGTDDAWVSITQARDMHEELDRNGIPNRLIEIEGARHGFELQIQAPKSRDLLPEVVDFLNKQNQVQPSNE